MANIKTIEISNQISTDNIILILRQVETGYRLDNIDGVFKTLPEEFPSAIEDDIEKGNFIFRESRAVWNNGLYVFKAYRNSVTAINLISQGEMYIINDIEVTLDGSVANCAVPGDRMDLVDSLNSITIDSIKLGLVTDEQLITHTNIILDALPENTGDVAVDHNFPTIDYLRYVDPSGSGIDNASILIFLKEDYDDGNKSMPFIKGVTSTGADGRWNNIIRLDANKTYIVEFYKQGLYQTSSMEITT